jgi:hypothetical protein
MVVSFTDKVGSGVTATVPESTTTALHSKAVYVTEYVVVPNGLTVIL